MYGWCFFFNFIGHKKNYIIKKNNLYILFRFERRIITYRFAIEFTLIASSSISILFLNKNIQDGNIPIRYLQIYSGGSV